MAERLTLELERRRAAPLLARRALCVFDHGLAPEREHDAELLLTELVSNAVKYGGGGVLEVHLERGERRFRAEVIDQGDGLKLAPRDPTDLDTPGGWGLQLVETLSDRWGTFRGSTHVWFEFALEE